MKAAATQPRAPAKRPRDGSGAAPTAAKRPKPSEVTPSAAVAAKRPKPSEVTPSAAVAAKPMMIVEPMGVQRTLSDRRMTNRQKCLVLSTRNIACRYRHLLSDLKDLMPHARDHPKIKVSKSNSGADHAARGGAAVAVNDYTLGNQLAELCDLHRCNSCLCFEPHRSDILCAWMLHLPQGPSVKCQISNIHTANEVNMAGNCLKYSRPLLHFDVEFERSPHLRVLKSMFQQMFNTPRYHPKSKPFVDHIICFFHLDKHVWFRHYQIVPGKDSHAGGDHGEGSAVEKELLGHATLRVRGSGGQSDRDCSLLEIGPRFTIDPIAIFDGCCSGSVLWKSQWMQTPTEQRRQRKLRQLEKIERNEAVHVQAERHRRVNPAPPPDPLGTVFRD